MQIKLLHNLVEEMAGENTGRIVDILFGKKDVNEFLISKKMELTINQVRNILYKLSADGLVSFIRKKDKRKGWYIYYWTLKTERCLARLESSLVDKIDNFEHILKSRETKRFYICKSCDIEVSEEKALENGFSCDECAEVYELADNDKPIRDMKARITRTTKNLELIRDELEIVRKKETRKREIANKKIKKEEDEKKLLMKEIRAAARKKVAEEKNASSKKVVKKSTKTVSKKASVKKTVAKKPTKKKTPVKKTAKKAVLAKKFVKKKAPVKKTVAKKPAKKKVASKLKKKLSGRK